MKYFLFALILAVTFASYAPKADAFFGGAADAVATAAVAGYGATTALSATDDDDDN